MNPAAMAAWVVIIAGYGELPAGEQSDAIADAFGISAPARSWTAVAGPPQGNVPPSERRPHPLVAALLE